MSRPSTELAGSVLPEVELRRPLAEHETMLSTDRARRVLGDQPAHSWRDG